MEFLEAPVENLAVIATTNVGSEYDIDEDDPAGKERFHILQQFVTDELLKRILAPVLKEKGWSVPNYLLKFVNFFNNMVRMKEDNNIAQTPSVRLLTRAILLSPKHSDLGPVLISMIPTWTERDPSGKPVEEQARDVTNLINTTF